MILLLGFLMMTGVAVAQQLQVQGKVTDATGEGRIGKGYNFGGDN